MFNEKKYLNNIRVAGATLISRNFEGRGSKWNAEGNRSFGVLLDDELAEDLINDGWNVKFLPPRDDDPESHRQACLFVKVKFGGKYPPNIILIDSYGKRLLNEDNVAQLDRTFIKNCDLVIRPYSYEETPTRPAGVSAYLKSIFITIEEDDFDRKYADIPFVGGNGYE